MNSISTLVEIIDYIEKHDNITHITFIAHNFPLHSVLSVYLNKLYPYKSIELVSIDTINIYKYIKENDTNTRLILCNDRDMPEEKVVRRLRKKFPLFVYSPIQVSNARKNG